MPSYPSRRSTRLRDFDYSQPGAYFVTVCIEQRLPLLGRITEGEMQLSAAGTMVADVWGTLGRYYPVEVDEYVVMPNHVHGILVLVNDTMREDPMVARADRDGATVSTGRRDVRRRGTVSVSAVIQRFKTFTMHEYGKGVAHEGWPRYPGRLWQHRFHEHVIRNDREFEAIREYIVNNPMQWQLDRENPDRVG